MLYKHIYTSRPQLLEGPRALPGPHERRRELTETQSKHA